MQYWLFVATLLLAAAISTAISRQVWKRRPAPGSTFFGLLMAALAFWSLTYAFQIASDSFALKVFWMKLSFVAIAVVPVLWLLFILTYTRRDQWLTRRNVALLFVMPAATILVMMTNEYHGLFWREIQQAPHLGTIWLDPIQHSWFWLHTLYSYMALGLGGVIILYTLMGSAHLYQYQGRALLVALLVPMIANITTILDLRPLPYLDITPFAFTISGLAIAWGIYRYQLLDVIPAARDLVLDNIQEGILVFDTNNRLIDANPAARAFLRQAIPGLGTLVGVKIEQMLAPWPDLLVRLTSSPENAQIELTTDGEPSFFELRLAPIRSRDGALTGQLLSITDVTARHVAEKLRLEKEAAEAARRAQNAFLANMSHELRTPLNHIIGYSELLIEESPDLAEDELVADLKKIHTSAKHLLGLISNVLEFSRLEAGMVKVAVEPLDAGALLQDAALAIQPKLAVRNNQLEWEPSTTLGVIETDAAKVRQVLLTLLENAAKFTENGRIHLWAERDDGWVAFHVSDTGIGMTPQQVAALFKPFTQADGSSTRRYDGTGLGLANSQRLCQLIGGTLRVHSELGRGSTFTVQIPAIASREPTQAKE